MKLAALVPVVTLSLFAGCAPVPTDLGAFQLRPDELAHLQPGQAVSLANGSPRNKRNGQPIKARVNVYGDLSHGGGKGFGHTERNVVLGSFTLDQDQLTETAIIILARALEKQGIQRRDQAEKTITLSLRPVRMEKNGMTGCAACALTHGPNRVVLAVEARFGDDSATTFEVLHEWPVMGGGRQAFDEAVPFALSRLLADEKFVAYLNR